jgi:hypothetical protein
MRGFHFVAEPKVSFVRKTLSVPSPILEKIFTAKNSLSNQKMNQWGVRFFLLLPASV